MKLYRTGEWKIGLARGLLASICAAPALAAAGGAPAPLDDEGPCSLTAAVARIACGHEAQDDYFVALGRCANLSDAGERTQCNAIATRLRDEAPGQCNEVFEARDDFCDAVGQGRYDPQIDPARFVDPADIGGAVAPNAWFPIVAGSFWVYAGGDERVTVQVTGETREIEGVTCAIVRDVAEVDGEVVEDTQDFFAQDVDGNVWYFGEVSQELEDGFIVSIDGSWEAGRELAKPGILFEAAPSPGDVYRQEFALGEAEDGARVLSTSASESVPAASCKGTCVLTADFNLLEPDSVEHKYYAPGVGTILETESDGSNRVELVSYRIGPP
jgi:hypothetical protein